MSFSTIFCQKTTYIFFMKSFCPSPKINKKNKVFFLEKDPDLVLLESSLKIQHVCQGGWLGLRPWPPPFCMKSAGGGTRSQGPLRPAITAPQASATPSNFTQKGGGWGLRPRQPSWQTCWIFSEIFKIVEGGYPGLRPRWLPSRQVFFFTQKQYITINK